MSNLNVCANVKPHTHKRKAHLLTTFWRRFWFLSLSQHFLIHTSRKRWHCERDDEVSLSFSSKRSTVRINACKALAKILNQKRQLDSLPIIPCSSFISSDPIFQQRVWQEKDFEQCLGWNYSEFLWTEAPGFNMSDNLHLYTADIFFAVW